jgi:hypothetical protein
MQHHPQVKELAGQVCEHEFFCYVGLKFYSYF